MPRLENVRRISVLRLEGAFKPIKSNQDDFPENINSKRAYKFNLENGDKGYVFIDQKINVFCHQFRRDFNNYDFREKF